MPLFNTLAENLFHSVKGSPTGRLLRNLLNVKPLYYKNIPAGSACSDLFLWKADADWSTKIDLMNITSQVFPGVKEQEKVRVLVFNCDGRLGSEMRYEIPPFDSLEVDISSLAGAASLGSVGSFAVLRDMSPDGPFKKIGACLSERGYAAFQRTGSSLKQYVHGNSYVLYAPPVSSRTSMYGYVRDNFFYEKIYRVQTPLIDCDSAVCHFLNPSQKAQEVLIEGFDGNNQSNFQSRHRVNSLGVLSVSVPVGVARLEARSKVFMLRPLIEKHYKTGVDFFHA